MRINTHKIKLFTQFNSNMIYFKERTVLRSTTVKSLNQNIANELQKISSTNSQEYYLFSTNFRFKCLFLSIQIDQYQGAQKCFPTLR